MRALGHPGLVPAHTPIDWKPQWVVFKRQGSILPS